MSAALGSFDYDEWSRKGINGAKFVIQIALIANLKNNFKN